MRQQTKPFIVERRPTPQTQTRRSKTVNLGKADDDIAQGLKDEREQDHAVATGGDNRG